MGSYDFRVKAKGKTAKEAFTDAVDEARAMSGGGGYTGTIAEKSDFYIAACPSGRDLEDHVEKLTGENDKWGPAACIPLGDGQYLFVGTAPS